MIYSALRKHDEIYGRAIIKIFSLKTPLSLPQLFPLRVSEAFREIGSFLKRKQGRVEIFTSFVALN